MKTNHMAYSYFSEAHLTGVLILKANYPSFWLEDREDFTTGQAHQLYVDGRVLVVWPQSLLSLRRSRS